MVNGYFPWPSRMLFSGGNLACRNAIIDLSGGDPQQLGGFRNGNTLAVPLIRPGNIMFITDSSDTGIGKAFSFRGG